MVEDREYKVVEAEKIPLIVLVGRPNVGKSSLFNMISGNSRALIDDTPGVTRDPLFHRVNWYGKIFDLVDMGGLGGSDILQEKIESEGLKWIREADLVLLVVDFKDGLLPLDKELIDKMRKENKRFYLLVNKADPPLNKVKLSEFYESGVDVEDIFPVSVKHKAGIEELMEHLNSQLSLPDLKEDKEDEPVKLTITGRPNVGKSSLLNKIIREERVLVSEIPGTTRDTIDIFFRWKKKDFILIDTPGIRRKSRIDSRVERKSSLKGIEILEKADISLLVMDSREGITTQDLRLLSLTQKRGRAVVIVFNKMDLVKGDPEKFKKKVIGYINFRYSFLQHTPIVFVSAKTGYGLASLYEAIIKTCNMYTMRITTGQLNRFFREIIEFHSHPLGKGFRPVKFYYITQVETKPPTFLLVTNKPEEVSENYLRYVKNKLKEKFQLTGVPVRIILKKRS